MTVVSPADIPLTGVPLVQAIYDAPMNPVLLKVPMAEGSCKMIVHGRVRRDIAGTIAIARRSNPALPLVLTYSVDGELYAEKYAPC